MLVSIPFLIFFRSQHFGFINSVFINLFPVNNFHRYLGVVDVRLRCSRSRERGVLLLQPNDGSETAARRRCLPHPSLCLQPLRNGTSGTFLLPRFIHFHFFIIRFSDFVYFIYHSMISVYIILRFCYFVVLIIAFPISDISYFVLLIFISLIDFRCSFFSKSLSSDFLGDELISWYELTHTAEMMDRGGPDFIITVSYFPIFPIFVFYQAKLSVLPHVSLIFAL